MGKGIGVEKISVQDVTFTYGSEGADVSAPAEPAVENLSLEIEKGSYTAILGANGSGKSTLAKLIDVIEVPDSGRIVVFGKDTADDSVFWQIRENSACVFQNPDNQIVASTNSDFVKHQAFQEDRSRSSPLRELLR